MNVGDNYNRPKVFRAIYCAEKDWDDLVKRFLDKRRLNHYNHFKLPLCTVTCTESKNTWLYAGKSFNLNDDQQGSPMHLTEVRCSQKSIK